MGCSASSSPALANQAQGHGPPPGHGPGHGQHPQEAARNKAAGPRFEQGTPAQRPAALSGKPLDRKNQNSFHEKYILQQKLGKGAFAQVYLCKPSPANKDMEPGKSFAAKVTDLRIVVDGKTTPEVDTRAKQTVEKEVQLLQTLTHIESILRVYDSFFEDCLSFIIVEKCDMSLLAALERLPELSERSMMQVFKQIFVGLDAMHKLFVVHRDIKPDNFLCKKPVTSDGMPIVKICDFGMAEQLPDARPALKGVYGTAPFMSPEMLGRKVYGTKTDIFSTFAVCYVLLLGKFPYQPVHANPKAMKTAILSGVPEPSFMSSSTLPDLSFRACDFLRTMFERDPDARLSAEQLLANKEYWTNHTDEWGSTSLRPMLHAAKRCGAFDTRRVKDDENDVDAALRQAQKRYHGSSDANSQCSTRLGDSSNSNPESSGGKNGSEARSV